MDSFITMLVDLLRNGVERDALNGVPREDEAGNPLPTPGMLPPGIIQDGADKLQGRDAQIKAALRAAGA